MQFTKALQHTIGWKALNTLFTFCINLLLVRIMGADYSGVFFYAVALYALFTIVLSGSLEAGITYYGSANINNIKILSVFILPWLLLQAIVCWIVLHVSGFEVDQQAAFIYIIANLIISYFSALYYAQKRFAALNIILCLVNLLVMIALVALYLVPDIALWGRHSIVVTEQTQVFIKQSYLAAKIFFGGFALQAVVLLIVFFRGIKEKVTPLQLSAGLVKKLLTYSLVAFVSNIIFFLVTRVDYYFVNEYCNQVALSNYVQVSKMGQLLVLLPTMMAAVIFPYSAGNDDQDYLKKTKALCRLMGLIFIPVIVGSVAFGYWLFPLLFGTGFTAMYGAFLLYLPGFYALSLVTILAAYLAGKGKLKVNLTASFIALVIVIAGDILLIPVAGINAAAAVSSLAYISCLAYQLITYKTVFQCRLLDFFYFKRDDLKLITGKF